MAPSAGTLHALLHKNVKLLRLAWRETSRIVQTQLPGSRVAPAELQPAFARNARHPIHPVAYLRQLKSRSFLTAARASARNFTTGTKHAGTPAFKYDRTSSPKSRVASAISASAGRAPFASTLRPNLTGGTLGRTAGGYALGSGRVGSARFFSHTPAAPAQVVQNVSQAVRAFFISGQKAQYDGISPRTGEKRYKAVSTLQKEVGRKINEIPKTSPGSFVDFSINPTITALTPLRAVTGLAMPTKETETLNTEGLLDILSVDFARALKDLAVILNDLKLLSGLGDLPITYECDTSNGKTRSHQSIALRVHFPGCDVETVERICDELGVRRGVVGQDQDFDVFAGTEIALLFPFAPSKTVSECSFYEKPVSERLRPYERLQWHDTFSPEEDSYAYSTQSDAGLDFEEVENHNPWLSSPSGYESFHSSEVEDPIPYREPSEKHTPLEYQGIEGIYRFIEQCDAARR